MAPFEALYGRKCQTPLMWSEVGERSLFGPDMIKEAEEQLAKVRENLKAAQSRHLPKTIGISTSIFCLFKSIAHQGHSQIPSQRKVSPKIHWAISDQ